MYVQWGFWEGPMCILISFISISKWAAHGFPVIKLNTCWKHAWLQQVIFWVLCNVPPYQSANWKYCSINWRQAITDRINSCSAITWRFIADTFFNFHKWTENFWPQAQKAQTPQSWFGQIMHVSSLTCSTKLCALVGITGHRWFKSCLVITRWSMAQRRACRRLSLNK